MTQEEWVKLEVKIALAQSVEVISEEKMTEDVEDLVSMEAVVLAPDVCAGLGIKENSALNVSSFRLVNKIRKYVSLFSNY